VSWTPLRRRLMRPAAAEIVTAGVGKHGLGLYISRGLRQRLGWRPGERLAVLVGEGEDAGLLRLQTDAAGAYRLYDSGAVQLRYHLDGTPAAAARAPLAWRLDGQALILTLPAAWSDADPAPPRRRPWTAAEDALLRARWPRDDHSDIARDLGRSLHACEMRAAALRVTRGHRPEPARAPAAPPPRDRAAETAAIAAHIAERGVTRCPPRFAVDSPQSGGRR
jgi:hypothetical protein